MLRLEKVNGRNVWDILKLKVAENQRSFVSANDRSIIEAIKLALEFIRTFPCGKAEYCWLSYEPENEVARRLYRSFGFVETGETDGNELIAVLKL